jgi:hypothetical protein
VNVTDSHIPASLFDFLINGRRRVYLMKTLHKLLRGVLVEPAFFKSKREQVPPRHYLAIYVACSESRPDVRPFC